MKTIIFCAGELEKGYFVEKTLSKLDLIIAADAGAKTAFALGLTPDIAIGDFDSLDDYTLELIKKKKITIIRAKREKDQTDTEMAVQYALDKKSNEIYILGGTQGNRLDHVLANLLISINKKAKISFVNGNQISWIEKGPKTIQIAGFKNDLLSLIAFSPKVINVNSMGLRYPLTNKIIALGSSLGISNEFLDKKVTIKFQKGLLLITHTHLTS